jgi:carbonic anhydrase
MTFTWQVRGALIVLVLTAIGAPAVWPFVSPPSAPALAESTALTDPDAIVAELEAGNARFVSSKRVRSTNTARDSAERQKLGATQKPFVALLTCADSRIVPEFIFDQHIGSIFCVRNAGNVVENVGLGSMEYGVEHLHTPVVMVLGHTACGAVAAVNKAGADPLPHHLKDVQQRMAGLKPSLCPKDSDSAFLTKLSEENAKQQAASLLALSEVLRDAWKKKHMIVVAAIYDLETGEVRFLDKNVAVRADP